MPSVRGANLDTNRVNATAQVPTGRAPPVGLACTSLMDLSPLIVAQQTLWEEGYPGPVPTGGLGDVYIQELVVLPHIPLFLKSPFEIWHIIAFIHFKQNTILSV